MVRQSEKHSKHVGNGSSRKLGETVNDTDLSLSSYINEGDAKTPSVVHYYRRSLFQYCGAQWRRRITGAVPLWTRWHGCRTMLIGTGLYGIALGTAGMALPIFSYPPLGSRHHHHALAPVPPGYLTRAFTPYSP